MERATAGAAILVACLLAGCAGGAGGPGLAGGPPDALETDMLAPDPMDDGEIDDATGTMMP